MTDVVTQTQAKESAAESISNANKEHDSDNDLGPGPSIEKLVNTATDKIAEKLDELSSLEREIAKMHHVEPITAAVNELTTSKTENVVDTATQGDSELQQRQQTPHETVSPIASDYVAGNGEFANKSEAHEAVVANVNDAFEHEDLIAVLKGIDQTTAEDHDELKPKRAVSATDSELAEGVTIEGEGQFQIMEVVDDEGDETYAPNPPSNISSTNTPINKLPYGIAKLTTDAERAVAMEQMADLQTLSDRKHRRKQDIKALPVETPDLIQSLGADWSDEETTNETQVLTSAATAGKTQSKLTAAIAKVKTSASVPSNKNADGTTKTANTTRATATVDQKRSNSPPKITSVVVLQAGKKKTAAASKHDAETQSSISKATDNKEAEATTQPQATTGFRRTRIIKRKIIWDPDAPETQFSYAQLVRQTPKVKQDEPAATAAHTTTTTTATNSGAGPAIKKEPPTKKARPITPKLASAASEHIEKKPTRAVTPAKAASSNVNQSTKSHAAIVEVAMRVASPAKRRSQTPVANGAAAAKKKKVSELDRLMGDEGAVNMLNSLESERSKAASEDGDDKPHKPLMRSRAATICERIIKPSVVKKESPAPTKNKRVKSKASSSWDYVYKQQASEDAMIIRRRSNSSYSSNASLHRLSLDAPVASAKQSSTNTSSTKAISNSVSNTSANTTSPSKTATTKQTTTTTKRDATHVAETSAKSAGSSRPTAPTASGKTFEFAKPESKSTQKTSGRSNKTNSTTTAQLTSDMKKAAGSRRQARSPATVDDKDKSTKTTAKEANDSGSVATNATDVIVRKTAKVAQILFNTHKAKLDYTFTAQMMNQLCEILDELSADANCHAVVMTTNAPHFCQGIDFSDLALGTAEKRKHAATQLAKAVKNYLKTLARFPKPLIAGVNGNNIGLGVTQLPLFDIVIASDKGTYETPYAKYGQLPEGFCIWNNSTKIRANFKTRLFWLGEKLHSPESALSGLVHKLTAASKVNDEALAVAAKIAAMSAESYRVMKQSLIQNQYAAIGSTLDKEFVTISEQWLSAECYANFKMYLDARNL